MGRTGWLAVLALALVGSGALLQLARRRVEPAGCDPSRLRAERDGQLLIARCGDDGGAAMPVEWQLTLGRKVALNRASEQELSRIPGVGPRLAHALVQARGDAGFVSWDAVDEVPGVGRSKLDILRKATALDPPGP